MPRVPAVTIAENKRQFQEPAGPGLACPLVQGRDWPGDAACRLLRRLLSHLLLLGGADFGLGISLFHIGHSIIDFLLRLLMRLQFFLVGLGVGFNIGLGFLRQRLVYLGAGLDAFLVGFSFCLDLCFSWARLVLRDGGKDCSGSQQGGQ